MAHMPYGRFRLIQYFLGRRCNTKQVRTTCGPNADCADTMRGHKCVCHDGMNITKLKALSLFKQSRNSL